MLRTNSSLICQVSSMYQACEIVSNGPTLTASIAPNPLNPSGVLTIRTTQEGTLRVRIFDPTGRLIRVLTPAGTLPAGYHDLEIEPRREFKQGLLKALCQTPRDWTAHRKNCIRYRSDFIAHLGSEPTMHTPFLDPVWKSASYYYDFLRMREMFDAIPSNIQDFYSRCAIVGREYYESRSPARSST